MNEVDVSYNGINSNYIDDYKTDCKTDADSDRLN